MRDIILFLILIVLYVGLDTADTQLKRIAIATEAQRAETENTGSVHEGAGPKDIAHD